LGDVDEGLVLVLVPPVLGQSPGEAVDVSPPAPDEPQPEPSAAVVEPATGDTERSVALTFYNCYGQGGGYCGGMAGGTGVYEGAAACGYEFRLGQRFSLGGRDFVCEDRGLGPYDWIDIFFWDY